MKTRKQLVFEFLWVNRDRWVTGPEIANEEVGGSEGLRRLREIRAMGLTIAERKHATRAVWEYRMILPHG